MKTKRQVQRRTITLRQKPVRHLEQGEDPELTPSQQRAILQLLNERMFLPVSNGTVVIRDVMVPAGGWERFDAKYPNLSELPIEKQLWLSLQG